MTVTHIDTARNQRRERARQEVMTKVNRADTPAEQMAIAENYAHAWMVALMLLAPDRVQEIVTQAAAHAASLKGAKRPQEEDYR